jgi:NAD(P)-dependent dehydrogenase (short-subunit alcohol dehydrogenase family)
MTSLLGKWSFVTGASRGVGAHLATGLADLGSNLVLHSRDLGHTAGLAEKLRATGVTVVTVAAELSDPAQIDSLLDRVQSVAPIDILYNNAAIQVPKQAANWQTSVDDLRRSLEVNLISLIRICDRLAPPMLERGWGRIINLTSGIADQPEQTAYAVSKAAVDKFVRDFAPKLRGTGVQMNLLDPGWLRTDLGGPNAPGDPASVLPGALVPALLDNGESGRFFRAQDYAGLSLDVALQKALTP